VITVHGFYQTPTWQLGDNFFRYYCVALNIQTGKIGFTKQAKNPPKDKALIQTDNLNNNIGLAISIHLWLVALIMKPVVTIIFMM
jgi:hypothetical protein